MLAGLKLGIGYGVGNQGWVKRNVRALNLSVTPNRASRRGVSKSHWVSVLGSQRRDDDEEAGSQNEAVFWAPLMRPSPPSRHLVVSVLVSLFSHWSQHMYRLDQPKLHRPPLPRLLHFNSPFPILRLIDHIHQLPSSPSESAKSMHKAQKAVRFLFSYRISKQHCEFHDCFHPLCGTQVLSIHILLNRRNPLLRSRLSDLSFLLFPFPSRFLFHPLGS